MTLIGFGRRTITTTTIKIKIIPIITIIIIIIIAKIIIIIRAMVPTIHLSILEDWIYLS